MKTEKSKDIVWSIVSIVVGGGAWLTMQNISWGIVDPAKVGLVFAVLGIISLLWALFSKYDDKPRERGGDSDR
ncbi:transglycosylase [Arthrobacter sp. UM1]|uniref:transglycosylase n=1 Tax=Arthrobacter sp. UM1 TaxID=2766776 RepID=UPI001CF65617|nr:transglycosylase [Arthrobacter sp. UM1]MCB4208868.1 transglycosylase [Arthrobacter sp. UM1]